MVKRFKGASGLIGKLVFGAGVLASSLIGGKVDGGIIQIYNLPSGTSGIGNTFLNMKNILGATEGYDGSYDATFLDSAQTNALQIYSISEGHNLKTDSRPIDTSGWNNINLGVKGSVSNIGNYLRYAVISTTDLTGKTLRLSDSNGLFTTTDLIMDGQPHDIILPTLTHGAGVYDTLRLDVLNPTNMYWDKNGTTSGAGGAAPTGNWNDAASWNTVADGTGTPLNWMPSVAVFSAGDDATGSYTVNVSGTQEIKGLTFKNGSATLNGGILKLIADSDIGTTSNDSIHSDITGTGRLTKTGTGTLVLGGSNDYGGGTVVNQGTLNIANADALQGNLEIGLNGSVVLDSGLASAIQLSGLEFLSGSASASGNALNGEVKSVPEPGTLAMLFGVGLGLGYRALVKRRRRGRFK